MQEKDINKDLISVNVFYFNAEHNGIQCFKKVISTYVYNNYGASNSSIMASPNT